MNLQQNSSELKYRNPSPDMVLVFHGFPFVSSFANSGILCICSFYLHATEQIDGLLTKTSTFTGVTGM
jgi:hypothetical protein